MKKFLTFFALLCALLGFSPQLSAETWYVIGDWNTWNRTYSNPDKMQQSGNVHSVQITTTADNQKFKLYYYVSDNDSRYDIGSGDGSIIGENDERKTFTMWFNSSDFANGNHGSDITIAKKGTYQLSIDRTNDGKSLVVSKVAYPTLYFRGEQTGTDWPASNDYKFSRSGNIYTLTVKGGIGSGAWKIADSGWSVGSCWGAPVGQSATLSNGVAYSLTKKTSQATNDPGDLKCNTNGKDATITFTYNLSGTSTVKVDWSEGPVKPAAPSITASGNTVTITKSGNGDIWYTTNGQDPTDSSSTRTKYSNSFTIEQGKTTTVKAAVVDGTTWSDVTTKNIYVGAADSFVLGTTAPQVKGYWIQTNDWNEKAFTQVGNHWEYTFIAGAINDSNETVDTNFKGDIYFVVKDSNGKYWHVDDARVNSPTNTYSNGSTTFNKNNQETKVSELTPGSTYIMTLTPTASGVEFNIEQSAADVLSVTSVELLKGTTKVADLANEGGTQWGVKYNSTDPNAKYHLKVTYQNADKTKTVTKYVAWAENDNWWLEKSENETSTPYTGDKTNCAFLIRSNGDYYIKVRFHEEGINANWLYVSTKDKIYDPTPNVETVLWSLSDDEILARGSKKYFYMSALQNDNRLSPEWELIKDEASGKYVLDNFVVIPSAEFRIREVSKSASGSLSFRDFGWGSEPYYIYSVSQDFRLPASGTVAEDSKHSASFTMSAVKDRGFLWNIGYSMVRLEFDPNGSSNNLTATIDFSYPSTLKQAPKPGMPWIGLTGSALTALSGGKQTLQFASELDGSNSSYQNAFTNAYIQWTADGKIYQYDRFVGEKYDGKPIYYVDGTPADDNRATRSHPQSGQVMSSTILPPRNAPQFKMTTSNGIATPPAEALTFEWIGINNTKQFKVNDKTTDAGVRYAVYEIQNVELEGMFKIFSGYGARYYGSVANGLSLFTNWGLDAADNDAYGKVSITENYTGPLSGAGPIIKNRSNGNESSDRNFNNVNCGTSGDYGNEDNNAGKYFELNNRQYVASLKLYYALDCDKNEDLHWADGNYYDDRNFTNNGRNFSWLDVDLTAVRPIISLDKIGVNTGRVKYSINKEEREGTPEIKTFQVVLYKIGDDFKYDRTTGEPSGTYSVVVDRSFDVEDQHITTFPERTYDRESLEKGRYIARIYEVTYNQDNVPIENTWNYSRIITVFAVESGTIDAEQRVTTKDGMDFYHPIIDVDPSVTEVIASLPSSASKADIEATVTVSNIGSKTRILAADETELPTSATDDNGMWYEITQEYKAATADTPEQTGIAVVHYPKGYFSSNDDTADFVLYGTRINAMTTTTLHVEVTGAVNTPADATDHELTYMPSAILEGRLVASSSSNTNTQTKYPDGFNVLAVTNSIQNMDDNGYARLHFADSQGKPCGIGSVDDEDVTVYAQVSYEYKAEDGSVAEKELFADNALLDMRENPDDEALYKAKRLKIGGVPYETEPGVDAAGEQIKVRKKQEAKFNVVLSYTTGGFAPAYTPAQTTTLTYNEDELTSPRQGLKDVLTVDDAAARTSDPTVAADITSITESYVENYGGLFTNIEDAHVALHAVDKNNDLVGYNSFDKWYMDHGDTFLDGVTPNPFSPRNHLAVNQNGAVSPADVHPLLKGDNAVKSASGFRNDGELNNAWWNQRASIKPEFHTDHIKGSLSETDGKLTWTAGSRHPKEHPNFWVGDKSSNYAAYNAYWNNGGVLKVKWPDGTEVDVDVRDPKHSYYGMDSHFNDKRSWTYLGEMPLNANDILCLVGKGNGNEGITEYYEVNKALFERTADANLESLIKAAKRLHNTYDTPIYDDAAKGATSITLDGKEYNIAISAATPWDYDNLWDAREKIAFHAKDSEFDETPAAHLFKLAGNHMFFKVHHVNHETWFVPGAKYPIIQYDIKTRPIWPAFEGREDWPANGSDTEKENYVMDLIRVNISDYCPLAYDVRYTYPFLTSPAYVTAENYVDARANNYSSIAAALANVKDADVSDVAARDKGRVSFFGATEPKEYVPTVISDVNDDIRGRGFSIVYNRAAGTVTVTAFGDRELKDAAVYDISGSSMIHGASADRVNDQTIVLDVRGIAQGAYIVSTNLGGAKFMK